MTTPAKFRHQPFIPHPRIYTGMRDEIDLGLPRVIWGREQGWLNVQDPGDGSWHSIPAKQAPTGWARLATMAKRGQR
jgi:hypothetical protein